MSKASNHSAALNNSQNQQASQQTGRNVQLISTFDQLTTFFVNQFSHAEVELPSANTVSITHDGLTQIYLGVELWNDFQQRLPYVEASHQAGIGVVCVGSDEELASFPIELKRPDIQQLSLPLTDQHLKQTWQSLHNFLTLVAHTNAEAREVEEANKNVKYVMSISRELNGERNIPKLLNLILTKAREICNADAGSIYTIDDPNVETKDGYLHFRFTQNDSIAQNLTEFKLPINESSIVGNSVLHEVTINIPDLYKLSSDPDSNPYGAVHDKTWDKKTGYESHSILTVPMFDISHNVIGVIQLINRKKNRHTRLSRLEDFAEEIIPFDDIDQEYAEIVAQQAGIALENANMQEDIKRLFDGFVNASVTAIEQRDPTTSGHSHRVAYLTVELAKFVDRVDSGPYKATGFTEDQLQEIEYASLLHDFGKLGVRENVLVKAKKLYPWQMEYLLQRFDLIRAMYEIEHLQKSVSYLKSPSSYPMGFNLQSFELEKIKKINDLEDFLRFIIKANEPTVLEQGGFEKLKDIANMAFKNIKGEKHPFLLSDELKALSVSRGSLTREEFAEIQSHVIHTYEFLRKIPWGKRLANVPQIAAKHHEKLDGTGYPTSAQSEEIPVQTRMMTIADIFDALTAADRPYKKSVPVEKALDILNMEVKSGKIDSELFNLFTESRIYHVVLDPSFTYKK